MSVEKSATLCELFLCIRWVGRKLDYYFKLTLTLFLPDKTLNKDEREREREKNGYFRSCVNLIKQGFPMNQTSLWLEKKPIYTLECLRQLQLVNHLLEEIIYKSKSHPPPLLPPLQIWSALEIRGVHGDIFSWVIRDELTRSESR